MAKSCEVQSTRCNSLQLPEEQVTLVSQPGLELLWVIERIVGLAQRSHRVEVPGVGALINAAGQQK
eukprot:SAG31_NODE_661_length_13035_cov_12.057591_15_plen_66_part_00